MSATDPRLLTTPIPPRLSRRPRDRGYPVPWFVGVGADGAYDFRFVDPQRIVEAVRDRRCFMCGEPLGVVLAFVTGPMSAINRIAPEPPSHRECAEYAARVCPFLTRPHARRRENDRPADVWMPGAPSLRNPGIALVWLTRAFAVVHEPPGLGILFHLADPHEVAWYCEGRPATRLEVLDGLEGALPHMRELCTTPELVDALADGLREALALVPEWEPSEPAAGRPGAAPGRRSS